MSFFKNIGKTLKGVLRGVSLNNIVKVATGNAGGVGKDLINRALKPHVGNDRAQDISNGQTASVVDEKVQQFSRNLAEKNQKYLAKTEILENVQKFFSKAWFQMLWSKYKKLIIAFVICIIVVFSYSMYKKRNKKIRR